MILSDGNNKFKNNTFDWQTWSAPIIQDPNELEEYFKQLNVFAKKIIGIKAVGLGYNLRPDDIEEWAYTKLKHLPEEERQTASNYKNIDPGTLYNRSAEVDEPLIIEFEDGETFEIEFGGATEVRVSKNSIPLEIQAGTNANNFEANVLFSNCLGHRIANVEIGRTNKITDWWPSPHGVEWEKQKEFISSVTLRLDSGDGLGFEPWIDFGEIHSVDAENNILQLAFIELRKGLYNGMYGKGYVE